MFYTHSLTEILSVLYSITQPPKKPYNIRQNALVLLSEVRTHISLIFCLKGTFWVRKNYQGTPPSNNIKQLIMSKFKLHIRFIIRTGDLNQSRHVPIRCRITYNKDRKDFSTGISVNPLQWDPIRRRLNDPSDQEEITNMQLSLIENQINKAFLMLQIREDPFTVQDIFNTYSGKTMKKDMGIIDVWDIHNERIEKLIGKEIVLVTYQKYLESRGHLKDFIRHQYKCPDMPLKELKMSFINEYNYYLKTEKNFQMSTLNKAIQRLRKVVKFALGHDYLDKDPFLLYTAKSVKKELVYLTQEELLKLENHQFDIKRVEAIKDCFVFCCYTGLAFKEMSNLRIEHIVKGYDGMDWIMMKRQKTQRIWLFHCFQKLYRSSISIAIIRIRCSRCLAMPGLMRI